MNYYTIASRATAVAADITRVQTWKTAVTGTSAAVLSLSADIMNTVLQPAYNSMISYVTALCASYPTSSAYFIRWNGAGPLNARDSYGDLTSGFGLFTSLTGNISGWQLSSLSAGVDPISYSTEGDPLLLSAQHFQFGMKYYYQEADTTSAILGLEQQAVYAQNSVDTIDAMITFYLETSSVFSQY